MIGRDHSTWETVVEAAADVVVVGDGPAGSALAAALLRLGVDVALVGPCAAWPATYTTWVDDLAEVGLLAGADIWAHSFERVAVRFGRTHEVDRAYGVIDNAALRGHLQRGVRHVVGRIDDPTKIDARLVVDATGWHPAPGSHGDVAWQTAFGVVLADRPGGPLGEPTMMDYSDPGVEIAGLASVPTFAYSLPVKGGWLVEETVLTASPAVEPDDLRPVLASRLGVSVEALLASAIATEYVRIPMGVPPPSLEGAGPVRFGAGAGMIHPGSGYSVGSALRSAERVAAAIGIELASGGVVDATAIRRAVWPRSARRARILHDYGHDVLARLDRDGIQRFFDAFFGLAPATWMPYLRLDTPPRRLVRVMADMFRAAPWRLRARLITGDPRRLVRLLRS